MTITIEYTNYPDIISIITIDTSIEQNFVISLTDANTIDIQANDSGTTDTVTNSMSKEELLDMIKVLQQMINQMN
ncbi:MAG: hypothetical protein KQ78_01890 [Candidatus Izimaplasma bacterium HR2]|nr:MAG: hypothetical protein KQ78_01890 [Candidatus Izimaplasma bacterium HR2]